MSLPDAGSSRYLNNSTTAAITTSAMLPGGEALYDPADIDRHLRKSLDLVIDGGMLVSEPSSVIDLTGEIPKVLRRGKGDVSLFE